MKIALVILKPAERTAICSAILHPIFLTRKSTISAGQYFSDTANTNGIMADFGLFLRIAIVPTPTNPLASKSRFPLNSPKRTGREKMQVMYQTTFIFCSRRASAMRKLFAQKKEVAISNPKTKKVGGAK
jgi:hypothetical protein